MMTATEIDKTCFIQPPLARQGYRMTKLAQSMPGRHAKCCAYTAMLSGLLVSQLALGAAQSALMACRELRDDQQRLN